MYETKSFRLSPASSNLHTANKPVCKTESETRIPKIEPPITPSTVLHEEEALKLSESISHLNSGEEVRDGSDYEDKVAAADFFSDLPEEIKVIIFEKLDARSLGRCALVSKDFNRTIYGSPLWKELDLRHICRGLYPLITRVIVQPFSYL